MNFLPENIFNDEFSDVLTVITDRTLHEEAPSMKTLLIEEYLVDDSGLSYDFMNNIDILFKYRSIFLHLVNDEGIFAQPFFYLINVRAKWYEF